MLFAFLLPFEVRSGSVVLGSTVLEPETEHVKRNRAQMCISVLDWWAEVLIG